MPYGASTANMQQFKPPQQQLQHAPLHRPAPAQHTLVAQTPQNAAMAVRPSHGNITEHQPAYEPSFSPHLEAFRHVNFHPSTQQTSSTFQNASQTADNGGRNAESESESASHLAEQGGAWMSAMDAANKRMSSTSLGAGTSVCLVCLSVCLTKCVCLSD